MNNIYGTSSGAVSMGNARMSQVRDLNQRIKEHNDDIANQVTQAKDQIQTTDTIKTAKDTAQNLWTGANMPDKIKSYNEWSNAKTATNPTTQALSVKDKLFGKIETSAQTPESIPDTPPTTALAEGTGTGATVLEQNATADSKLADGLKGSAGLTEEGASKLGKLAGGAGVLASAAVGGMDLYNDFKGSPHLTGNNGWEKAGNLLQIGGSIGDVVGTVYPPAKLIGGILDLASGALNEVGEATDTTEADKEDAIQQTQTETQVEAPPPQTLTTGRVQ